MNKIFQSDIVKYVIALAVGIGIGAIFYPTKTIETEIESKYRSKIEMLESEKLYIQTKYSEELNREIKSNIEYRKQTESKISSLRTENTHLRQKSKERIVKIIKPDGTITEETIRESETEVISQVITDIKSEYIEKVTSIEKKYESIHRSRIKSIQRDYDKQIKEKEEIISAYKKNEKIEINKRAFGVAVGVRNENKFYSGISYDIYGPFFLDLHLESTKELNDTGAGVGLGMRF